MINQIETFAVNAISLRSRLNGESLEACLLDFERQFNAKLDCNFDLLAKLALSKSEVFVPSINELYNLAENVALSDILPEYRKQNGVVFTPLEVSSHICRSANKHWVALNRAKGFPATIADLSCGIGSFLLSLASIADPNAIVYGNDLNENFLKIAKILMWSINSEVVFSNHSQLSLDQENLFSKPANENLKYDLIVGNPPYVRSSILEETYRKRLRERYSSLGTGSFDLSIAFIEDALSKLHDGGLLSYIVTSKFTNAAYGKNICNLIAQKYRVVNIEDYGDAQVFNNATTYTMCLNIAKLAPNKSFTVTTFPNRIASNIEFDKGEAAFISSKHLSEHPWQFAAGLNQKIIAKTQSIKNPRLIDCVGEAFQGLRTGANNVFMLDDSVEIENETIVPFVNAKNIKPGSIKGETGRLLFPYTMDGFGKYQLIPEQILIERYPNAYKYLLKNKLSLKERCLDKNACWYGYSRPQNLEKIPTQKLLIKEMMPSAEFAADSNGEYAFAAGYALAAGSISNSDLQLWVSILNTPTMEFILRNAGTQLHSGWFRLQKQHLNRVRVPQLSDAAKKKIFEIISSTQKTSHEIQKEVDLVVSNAFGLSKEEFTNLHAFIHSAHSKSKKGKSAPAIDTVSKFEPVKLTEYDKYHRERFDLKSDVTFRMNKSAPIHRWYKYTQGYSTTLVHKLLDELNVQPSDIVFDPFMGCGTTLLTCKSVGISSIGMDISPLMKWVTDVKTQNYSLTKLTEVVEKFMAKEIFSDTEVNYGGDIFERYFSRAYSSTVVTQIFAIKATMSKLECSEKNRNFLYMALVSVLEDISKIRKHGSHYRFLDNPNSVGLQKLNIAMFDDQKSVKDEVLKKLHIMLFDIESLTLRAKPASVAQVGDAKQANSIKSNSIDHVITSPPYLNRNNYIAQQKAELSVLSMISSTARYKELVKSSLSSHVEAEMPQLAVSRFDEVSEILKNIHLEPGNNVKIPNMICGYFNDLYEVLASTYRVLKKNGTASFVVGNTRWGGVVVPIDHILAKFGTEIGFQVERILVTRYKGNSPQQMKKFGKIDVRESIVVLRKPA